MEQTQAQAKERGRRIEVIGTVVSDKMDKTIKVQTYRLVKHDRYHKYIRRSSVFRAHDEENKAKTGDKVKIVETRPLSKTKRFRLVEVVEVAKG
jgi:small subunit ribosomal protein S17